MMRDRLALAVEQIEAAEGLFGSGWGNDQASTFFDADLALSRGRFVAMRLDAGKPKPKAGPGAGRVYQPVRGTGAPQRRFDMVKAHGDRNRAALPQWHRAVVTRHTLFPSTVVDAKASTRLLVDGVNSPKIGNRVKKGHWRGMRIYTLTLEERATCPRSCGLWRECYGNAMPFSRRHRVSAGFFDKLSEELQHKAWRYPDGFVVRLHVLGDFSSLAYVAFWARKMRDLLPLRVFGYTAHGRETPIGDAIARLNAQHPTRWAIRFSVDPDEACMVDLPMQATTIWRIPETRVVEEGIVCPMQLGNTTCCGSCGLCWEPAAADRRVVFIGHGSYGRSPVAHAV